MPCSKRWTSWRPMTRRCRALPLQPTGYYVKFNPQDSVQMATLDGLGIELFSHPLDNGIYPETEPEEVTEDTPIVYEPLYAVVPAGFVFPEEVDYELIHGVFIQNKRGPASDEGQLPAGGVCQRIGCVASTDGQRISCKEHRTAVPAFGEAQV